MEWGVYVSGFFFQFFVLVACSSLVHSWLSCVVAETMTGVADECWKIISINTLRNSRAFIRHHCYMVLKVSTLLLIDPGYFKVAHRSCLKQTKFLEMSVPTMDCFVASN
jgi:hypothetical protein